MGGVQGTPVVRWFVLGVSWFLSGPPSPVSASQGWTDRLVSMGGAGRAAVRGLHD